MMPFASVWDTALWLAGLIVLWLVASVPAHWFLSVWLQLRAALSTAMSSLFGLVHRGRMAREASAVAARQELMDGKSLAEVDQIAAAAWKETLRAMGESVRVGSSQIENVSTAAAAATKQVEQLGQRLRKLRLVSGVLPEIPSPDEALSRVRKNRMAVINLVIAMILLVPISAANAQLTGLVIREVIPPVQPILGVPVAYVIALLIVVAEATIGLLHSEEAEKLEGAESKISVMLVIWSFAAIAVVGIETLLYAQVQPESSGLKWTSGGSAFALVGALLGLAVFGLGRLAHSSGMTLRKDRTPKAVAKQLGRLKDAAEEWNAIAEKIQPSQQSAANHYDRLAKLCKEVADAQGQSAGQFLQLLDRERHVLPAWARPADRPLAPSELREREWRTYVWLVVAVVSTASLAVMCGQFAARVSDSAGMGIGIGLAATSFAVGLMGGQTMPRTSPWRMWLYAGLWVAIALIAVVVGRVLQGVVGLRSVLVVVPALGALAAGLQIGPVAAFLRLPILWLLHRVIDLVLYTAVSMLWLVGVLTAVVEHVARLVAWPMTMILAAIKNRRTQDSHASAS